MIIHIYIIYIYHDPIGIIYHDYPMWIILLYHIYNYLYIISLYHDLNIHICNFEEPGNLLYMMILSPIWTNPQGPRHGVEAEDLRRSHSEAALGRRRSRCSKKDREKSRKYMSSPVINRWNSRKSPLKNCFGWLVVWLPFFAFSHILGMSSSQLTFIFSEGFKPPTSFVGLFFFWSIGDDYRVDQNFYVGKFPRTVCLGTWSKKRG